jgi:hypothetical protein
VEGLPRKGIGGAALSVVRAVLLAPAVPVGWCMW